jgi:hypothetical protein
VSWYGKRAEGTHIYARHTLTLIIARSGPAFTWPRLWPIDDHFTLSMATRQFPNFHPTLVLKVVQYSLSRTIEGD